MGFFEKVEPLDQRVLQGSGMDIIQFIARQQAALVKVRKDRVKVRFNATCNKKREKVQQIINAGFVSEDYTIATKIGLKLTDKGWDLVGGRPFWMDCL